MRRFKGSRQVLFTIGIMLGLVWTILAQVPTDAALRSGFENPPDSAKPRVWWHWMNGNITKDGIKLDLEWMKRTGIGGFQNFDAALSTPQVVEKRLVYMTPEWKDAFRYAATLADKFGLEMAIAGSPGWSESGGPWVPPAQAMKKFVWSETRIEGGHPFTGTLPKPPSITGPFQNIGFASFLEGLTGHASKSKPDFYADSAVVAYRAPDSDMPIIQLQPKVSASGGQFTLAALIDGDLVTATPLPIAAPNEMAWIQFEFPAPQKIHAFTLAIASLVRNPWGPPADSGQALEASDDGQQFKPVAKVPGNGAVANTVAFPEVTAKFFRMTFKSPPRSPSLDNDIPGLKPPPAPTNYQIAELVLHAGARVNRFEEKAGFAALPDLYALATPAVRAGDAVDEKLVIDLSSKMRPDGNLDWTPPAGNWVVLRMGYSLLGITNHPASPEATGLEVDKLSRPAVKAYFENYLGQYKDTVGPLMGKRGLQYVVTDSWEAGTQNWTDDMLKEFNKRRGYDMHAWLPVLTGRVVESAEASDRFLWDFRKTIGELTVENHYDQLTALLHERGMGRYSESHESGRAFIADGMEVKRNADVPMSAMWTQAPGDTGETFGYNADIRESAAVAHIYGQNIVAAESLTAIGTAWQWSPETLKPTADKEMANGLNRFVIHTSVHQPVSDKLPGLGLGPYGQWFTRHETWAEQAKPWITYLTRSCYMLQQGKFVADVLYFYGEDSNLTAIFGGKSPDVPAGYNFDYVNADALLNRLSVQSAQLTTPSGMHYRLLVLDPYSRHMSLPVLRKIRDLVNAGAEVVGAKPTDTPSLSDKPSEFQTIVDQLWGSGKGERALGKGKVYAGNTPAEALSAQAVQPDFEYAKSQPDTSLLFVHRSLPGSEVYWVNNRNNRAEKLDATFRVQGREAEIWHPDTGLTEPASYRAAGGRTTIPLRLGPRDAVFVVFGKATNAQSREVAEQVETTLAPVEGSWNLNFQADRGAPAQFTLEKLSSWSESADTGVKYFSGTATYGKTLQAPADWFKPKSQIWLELGDVKNLAEVIVNGKSLGIVWHAPFRVDVSGALKQGQNELQIKVTNLWVNRLIGDQQPNAGKTYTYTTQKFYRADSPLLASGLLGPVNIVRKAIQ